MARSPTRRRRCIGFGATKRTSARCVTALVVLGMSACIQADIDGRVGLASSYVYRGLNHSLTSPAPSIGLEYRAPRLGFYAGTWNSRVDLGDNWPNVMESDLYVGLVKAISPRVSIDSNITRYLYPFDRSDPKPYAWTEWLTTVHVDQRMSLSFGVAHDWWRQDEVTYVTELSYRHLLPARFVGFATVGQQWVKRAIDTRYVYYEVGVNRYLGPIQIGASISGTDNRANARLGRWTGTRAIGFLSWSF